MRYDDGLFHDTAHNHETICQEYSVREQDTYDGRYVQEGLLV